jgi:hypothetical protein
MVVMGNAPTGIPLLEYEHQPPPQGVGLAPLFDTGYTTPGQLNFLQQFVASSKVCR